jgi:6-phosphogluconolactonase
VGGVSQLSDYSLHFLVIGCYTPIAGGAGVGLSVAARDPVTGALRPHGEPTPTEAPSFVVRHPRLPLIYAVNELKEGAVSAFAMSDASQHPEPLGIWPTGGIEPCHLAVSGDELLVANYGSGSVSRFSLDAQGLPAAEPGVVHHTGGGPHPERQTGPHAHHITRVGDDLVAVDLGADALLVHRPGSEPEVVAQLPPGTGPRHLTVAGDTAYLVGELSGTVMALGLPDWRLRSSVPASTIAGGFPSEVVATDRFLYVANRGPDTISTFTLDDLTFVGEVPTGGTWPRHFVHIEQFLYVANERSHTVTVFRVDEQTGLPVPTGDVFPTPSPTCLLPW